MQATVNNLPLVIVLLDGAGSQTRIQDALDPQLAGATAGQLAGRLNVTASRKLCAPLTCTQVAALADVTVERCVAAFANILLPFSVCMAKHIGEPNPAGSSSQLFSRQGYSATSIDEIVKACGITKGNLYHHFSSKEALVLAAMDQVHAHCASERAFWFILATKARVPPG